MLLGILNHAPCRAPSECCAVYAAGHPDSKLAGEVQLIQNPDCGDAMFHTGFAAGHRYRLASYGMGTLDADQSHL